MQSSDDVQKIIPSLQVTIWKLKQVLLPMINTFIWRKPNLSIYICPILMTLLLLSRNFSNNPKLLNSLQSLTGGTKTSRWVYMYYTALFSMHWSTAHFWKHTMSKFWLCNLVLDTGKQVTCNNNSHEKSNSLKIYYPLI